MPPDVSQTAAKLDSTPRPGARRKPGPRPGQPHAGQFKRGDPRINKYGPYPTEERRTFHQLVQEASPRAVEVLVECLDDPTATWKDRQTAAQALIEHGFGKAVDRIQVANITGTGGDTRAVPKQLLDQRVAALMAESDEMVADYEEISDV